MNNNLEKNVKWIGSICIVSFFLLACIFKCFAVTTPELQKLDVNIPIEFGDDDASILAIQNEDSLIMQLYPRFPSKNNVDQASKKIIAFHPSTQRSENLIDLSNEENLSINQTKLLSSQYLLASLKNLSDNSYEMRLYNLKDGNYEQIEVLNNVPENAYFVFDAVATDEIIYISQLDYDNSENPDYYMYTWDVNKKEFTKTEHKCGSFVKDDTNIYLMYQDDKGRYIENLSSGEKSYPDNNQNVIGYTILNNKKLCIYDGQYKIVDADTKEVYYDGESLYNDKPYNFFGLQNSLSYISPLVAGADEVPLIRTRGDKVETTILKYPLASIEDEDKFVRQIFITSPDSDCFLLASLLFNGEEAPEVKIDLYKDVQ